MESRSWEFLACVVLCILYIPLFAVYVPCSRPMRGCVHMLTSFRLLSARYVCVMKSVPEQVWYANARRVGDGGVQLRHMGNVVLASRRLLAAGRT